MPDFTELIGRTVIYSEKNLMAICRLSSTDLEGSYQNFTLEVIDAINCTKIGLKKGDQFELGFESEYITYEHDILSASFYISWRLIFNASIISKACSYVPVEGIALGKYVKGLVKELLYPELYAQ